MKIFVAGSSQDRWAIRLVIEALRTMGHEVFDWTRDPGFEDAKYYDPFDSAAKDLKAVNRADGVIWLLGSPSHGAPFEAGYARGRGKPVVGLWVGEPHDKWIYTTKIEMTFSLEEALEFIRDYENGGEAN